MPATPHYQDAIRQVLALHAPVETEHVATITDEGITEIEPDSFEDITGRSVVCVTCQGYKPHPCATYTAVADFAVMASESDVETARITIRRTLTDDDVLDYVDAVVPGGDALPLTEALGMMRLAEDTLIRQHMDEQL